MNIDYLIKNHLHKDAEERKERERQELRQFLDYRSWDDKGSSKFMQMLDQSKTKFGPHALKLAEDFIQK